MCFQRNFGSTLANKTLYFHQEKAIKIEKIKMMGGLKLKSQLSLDKVISNRSVLTGKKGTRWHNKIFRSQVEHRRLFTISFWDNFVDFYCFCSRKQLKSKKYYYCCFLFCLVWLVITFIVPGNIERTRRPPFMAAFLNPPSSCRQTRLLGPLFGRL